MTKPAWSILPDEWKPILVQICQNFPIDVNLSFFESVHELAVAHVLQTACSIDTDSPKSSVLTFFLFSAYIGVGISFVNRIIYNADCLTTSSVKTFCSF